MLLVCSNLIVIRVAEGKNRAVSSQYFGKLCMGRASRRREGCIISVASWLSALEERYQQKVKPPLT